MNKAVAILFVALGVAYAVVRPSQSRGPLPADARGLAAYVAAHPADWLAASALTEKALDAPVQDRLALWHAANTLAMSLASSRPEPRAAFARSGFFHWGELSEGVRKAVLDEYEPNLHDWETSSTVYEPILTLTGDFGYLRRAQPHSEQSVRYLKELAAKHGLFDDYRALRAELPAGAPQVLSGAPDASGWAGLCDGLLCRSAWQDVDAGHAVAVTLATAQTDDVPPYVEVYVDDALRAEGVVIGEQTLTAPVDKVGKHRVEVRLINPATLKGTRQRVRIVMLQSL